MQRLVAGEVRLHRARAEGVAGGWGERVEIHQRHPARHDGAVAAVEDLAPRRRAETGRSPGRAGVADKMRLAPQEVLGAVAEAEGRVAEEPWVV